MDALFDGLKVVDAGTWIAGPVAATILADYGADVVKVEMPGSGDAYRRFATSPGTPQADVNYAWVQDARNKRSITVNLKTDAGRTILKQLAARCDVYVTNHPLHMRRRFGLTYEDLKPLNPRMIYASLTAYGENGPEKDREGFDLVAYWSRSGMMDVVRAPGATPAPSLPGMGDHPTAITMYASIVTALLDRERTGVGRMVHTSLLANGVWAASAIAGAKFANGSDFSDYPSRGPRHFTREVYETADGRWLQLSFVRSEEEVRHLFDVLGIAELLDEPRFATRQARLKSGTALADRLRPLLASRTATEWMALFKAHDVPASLVGTIADLADDPQLTANDIVAKPLDDVGADYVINHPVNVDGMYRAGVRLAPEVGEHTDAVLAELGYGEDDIEALRAQGAV